MHVEDYRYNCAHHLHNNGTLLLLALSLYWITQYLDLRKYLPHMNGDDREQNSIIVLLFNSPYQVLTFYTLHTCFSDK